MRLMIFKAILIVSGLDSGDFHGALIPLGRLGILRFLGIDLPMSVLARLVFVGLYGKKPSLVI